MEREIIKLPRELIAPILCPDIFEEEEYNKYFKIDADEDPDLSKEEWNIWNNFEIVFEEITEYDLEKSYEVIETVVKRISDGKYFKGIWIRSYYRNDSYPTELEEVFPKEKTITIYE